MRSGRLLIVIIGIVIAISASVLFTGVGKVANADSSEVLTLSPASNMSMVTANGSITTVLPERQPYNPNIDVYLTGVRLGQTSNTIKSHFASNERIKIYNASDVEIGENDRVGTGYVVRLYNASQVMTDEITICIKGDVDGDGYINSDDVTAISMHMRGNVILEGAYLVAADVYPTICGDGYISGQDKIYMSLQVSNLILHPTTYTITFDSNGGNTVTSITEEAGATITSPDSPIKTGYNFNGWYSDVGLTTAYTFTTMPEEDITLYAKWSLTNYSIIYHNLKGADNSANPSSYTIELEDFEILSISLIGYVFEGWYDDEEMTQIANTSVNTALMEDLVFYAKLIPIQYTISYNNINGADNSMNLLEYSIESESFTIANLTLMGHTFDGWYYDEEFMEEADTNITQGTTGNLYFYAKWTANIYAISLDMQGGIDGDDMVIATYGQPMPLANAPSKIGFTFGGYYTGINGTGTQYYCGNMTSVNDYNLTYDITLYAKWLVVYLITFDSQGGAGGSDNVNAVIEQPMPNAIAPVKAGYSFGGYFTGINGTGTQYYTSTMASAKDWDIASATTLYAFWYIYYREGNYLYFGEFPQTLKDDNVIVSDTPDVDGYFLGSDGIRYAKVVSTPYATNYMFNNDESIISGETYYFKVEPIRWRILSESGGVAFIMSDNILINRRFFNGSNNNYANSSIRAWLNNEFYTDAFTSMQRSLILSTYVDNSVSSTGYNPNKYACADTNDKIFLLSFAEATNSSYGFSGGSAYDTARYVITSDYSRASGASVSHYYGGTGIWWLRSPEPSNVARVRYVNHDGRATSGASSNSNYLGIVPSMRIQL